MAFLNWDKSHQVNIQIIDEQHLKLVNFLNELYELLNSRDKTKINNLLTEFYNEMKIHFETEESLIKKYKFHRYFSHKQEHDQVLNKVGKQIEEIKSDKRKLDMDFLTSRKNWMLNHFIINDEKLGKFLVENGLS